LSSGEEERYDRATWEDRQKGEKRPFVKKKNGGGGFQGFTLTICHGEEKEEGARERIVCRCGSEIEELEERAKDPAEENCPHGHVQSRMDLLEAIGTSTQNTILQHVANNNRFQKNIILLQRREHETSVSGETPRTSAGELEARHAGH
jgi:hypothetical protein